MPDTQTTMEQFIATNRISMTSDRVDSNPNNKEWTDADHWKVVLTRRTSKDNVKPANRQYANLARDGVSIGQVAAKLTTYFSMGYGHNGKEPDAASALDCLASDASSIDNARSFEDWASDLGYDPDSRKAETIYKDCEHSASRLKRFLGDDLYKQLLYETERL